MKVEKRRGGGNANVCFRDSYNLMPMSLAALVPAFDLDVIDKPWFPHLANNSKNFGMTLPTLPPKSDYLYNGFMPKKRDAFDAWYESNKNRPFELDEELASYCTNDVEILISALVTKVFIRIPNIFQVEFRKEFLEISSRPFPHGINNSKKPHAGIDVLCECMTIARYSYYTFHSFN